MPSNEFREYVKDVPDVVQIVTWQISFTTGYPGHGDKVFTEHFTGPNPVAARSMLTRNCPDARLDPNAPRVKNSMVHLTVEGVREAIKKFAEKGITV